MHSSRVHLACGAVLRVRRCPTSSLTRVLVASHITKSRQTQSTVRVCSTWRRSGNGAYWRNSQRSHNGEFSKPEQFPKGAAPYELLQREKMWRERMDRIRRMVKHDPYEALFGYSNRLLKGMRGDWINEHDKWWQREMSFTVRNPFAVEKQTEDTGQGATEVEVHGRGPTDTAVGLPKRGAVAPTASSISAEPELEYDPISNRMIRKSKEPLSSNEHTIASTATNSESGGQTHLELPSEHQERSVKDTITTPARANPSFTMLKEDLTHAPPTATKTASAHTSPARAEYEAYKATRLSQVTRSDQWLEEQGFKDYQKSSLESREHSQRTTMEKQFDKLHSAEQEVAEDCVLDSGPWPVQRSKGTSLSRPRYGTRDERPQPKMPAYDESKADEEIHNYTMQVAGDNLKNKRLLEKRKTGQPAHHEPLFHPHADATSQRDVFDYTMRVASTNLKSKRLVDRAKEKEVTDTLLAEMRRKQFAEFNKESKGLAQRSKQELELHKPAFEALEHIKNMVEEIKDETAAIERQNNVSAETAISGPSTEERPLETSLRRYQDRNDSGTPSQLQTSLQRYAKHAIPLASNASDEQVTTTTQVRTHDPVGYSHARESARLKQLFSETRRPFKVPSLAEMVGYKKDVQSPSTRKVGESDSDLSNSRLKNEVDAQKTAFSTFETARATPAAETKVECSSTRDEAGSVPKRTASELKQKENDAALVREIRYIYEDKYGPITTTHTQSAKVDVPAVQAHVSAPGISNVEAMNEGTDSKQSAASPPTARRNPQSEPASSLTAPTPAKTAMYTILAYDSKSKNMTTASFESIPSVTETSIPATVALRHLAYANRFLPKLIELQHRGFVPVHAERNLLILRQDTGKNVAIDKAFEAGVDPIKNETPVADLESTAAKEPKRLEPVFSGKQSQKDRERAWRNWKEARWQARQGRRRRFRRAVKFVAGGVVLSGAVIYLAGVGAEIRHNRGRGKVVVTDERLR